MEKETGKRRLRILQVFGSSGMPSCGVTDAARLGQDGEADTVYFGDSSEHIEPGTPLYCFPIWLFYRYTPWQLSKSPRNMQKFFEKKARNKRKK